MNFEQMSKEELKDLLLKASDSYYNKSESIMSDEDFDKLLADIKKNAKETAGTVSNINTARRLIIYLAKQLEK